MLTLAVLAFAAFAIIPAVMWVMGLVFRMIGWTMRMVFGVLLLPLWIVMADIGGLAFAARAIIPIAVVMFIISLLVPEN